MGVCRTHYAANLMSVTPKSMWPAVKAMLHSVYDQPNAAPDSLSSTGCWTTSPRSSPPWPSDLAAAPEDILAFTTSPKDVWTQTWSDDPAERPNKEIRRHADAVVIFPDRDAIVRLVGAVLAEPTDEWAEGCRYP